MNTSKGEKETFKLFDALGAASSDKKHHYIFQGRIYGFYVKRYINNSTITESMMVLVPLLDKNNRPCMFDLVKREYYYNQGTGEFKYG